jgi:ribosome-binding protein aMBF1 (putative translation factor)
LSNDMWCDFCGDKPKADTVKVQGKSYDVCNHCASLAVQDKK